MMAKTKREFLFASFIISCAATIISIVSVATNQWVLAEIKPNLEGININSNVNYGLLFGTFEERLLSNPNNKHISIACVFSENACAFSAAETKKAREEEINGIITGTSCNNIKNEIQTITVYNILNHIFNQDISEEVVDENYVKENRKKFAYKQQKENEITTPAGSTESPIIKCDSTFLNAGLWITTLIFAVEGIIMGIFSAIISVMNVAGNPVNPWLNVWGLKIWNGIAASAHLLTLILWGIHYNLFIDYNIGIIDTLSGSYSNKSTSLGYSYWILMPAMFLHIINILLIFIRQHLIDKQPELQEEINTYQDGMIFVY